MFSKLLTGGLFLMASSVLDARAPVDRYSLSVVRSLRDEPTCWRGGFHLSPEEIARFVRHDRMESVCGPGEGRFHRACMDLVERLEPACDGASWCRGVLDAP